ncbi:hypothetical protein AOQ84DRAFT_356846 [Glonium stellatum]|uniref:Amino acid transporter transmembrane domain-containing protein n=1 Tax=Glonium stellatum TaxID=574774 RepID=A0A8E2JNF2_9PEZI|nr:hypothetical protein AOQ84DRAFT_356846 [Glonium stellatum]
MTDTPNNGHGEGEADIVSRHLPQGYSAGSDALISEHQSSQPSLDNSHPPEQSSLRLLGGDIHRDIYKIQARAKLHKRSATFAHPSIPPSDDFPAPDNTISAEEQQAPGGFRRQYLLQRQSSHFHAATKPLTESFVAFLDLYGSFAGEDLAESEDESAIEDEESSPPEARPLLGHRRSSRRLAKQGDAGLTKSFFTLLKAFIGTGIMFLPKAFKNGGILFSSITLVTVSIISCICFHLLLSCRKLYEGGYGEIGQAIAGPRFRKLILVSIFISQIGFVCAGIIFTAENLSSFLEAVMKSSRHPSPNFLIAMQLALVIPLALIRNISKLGPAALVADVCILFGLVYIWWYDISTLSARGIHPTVELFNPQDFTLTVGSAIFTFEGIGLILPIQSSMAEPRKFDRLLYLVMFIITIIFTSVGAMCYAAFGENTRVEVITNFPQSSKLVQAMQFLYSLAVLVGTPVQLFPAIRIVETSFFGEKSGKSSTTTKWKKNMFRAALTIACGLIAIAGASDLDKFVALIGSFACVPLVYIYPPLLHLKGVARSKLVQGCDILLIVVGLVAMGYSTTITVLKWSS